MAGNKRLLIFRDKICTYSETRFAHIQRQDLHRSKIQAESKVEKKHKTYFSEISIISE
jgi:hypothetical protein